MLSENIKNLRKAKGISQEELAIKLNVVRQTISKWEKGLSVPDSEMLIKLAEELDTTVNILLGETVEPTETTEIQALAAKLELLNEQFAKRNETRRKVWRIVFLVLGVLAFLSIVNVKTGYAVNYLIPQGYAIMATPSAKKVLAENLRQRAHKIAKFVGDAEALAAKLAETTVQVSAKVSESGKIYGSITTAQLAEALAAAGIEVDKKDITVEAAKELGTYEATVKCYRDIKGTFKYEIVAE